LAHLVSPYKSENASAFEFTPLSQKTHPYHNFSNLFSKPVTLVLMGKKMDSFDATLDIDHWLV
jgi:hypothetical protein